MTTPNTPANGGRIPQWHERTDKMDDASIIAALKSEIADLRASLAAPAIPTVDRNSVLEEAAALCVSSAAPYDEAAREQGIDPETENVRKILRDECDSLKLAIRALKSAAPASAPQYLPPSELTWLYTHCRAIGMTCKSDSGKWEHDIALFTTNLQAEIKAAQDVAQPAAQVAVMSRLDKECLRIGQEIQRAAGELPEGWNMEIEVERGYGGVKLANEDGTDQGDFSDHDGLSYSIAAAIDAALATPATVKTAEGE